MRALLSRDSLIGREELEAWLAPSAEDTVSDSELRCLLDADADAIAAENKRSMVFALAVLKDLYADDADVRAWLARGRREFDGLAAAELLRTGRAHEVESLLVRLWNYPIKPQRRRPTYLRRTSATAPSLRGPE